MEKAKNITAIDKEKRGAYLIRLREHKLGIRSVAPSFI